jgi:hypothetical protein
MIFSGHRLASLRIMPQHSKETVVASGVAFALAFISVVVAASLYRKWTHLRRAEFVRTYRWPAGLLARLEKHRPGLARKDSALVSRGLRQFFVAYLMSGKRFVSMPSQIADDLWHEFILYTREYDAFCRRAFGEFLHHTPAVVLSEHRRSNEGLRRVWWYCCKYESIDPVKPTRLPLLFALDTKLNIPDGFVYHPQCKELRQNGSGAVYCGGDFADSSVDGSSAGFGEAASDGGGHGGHGDAAGGHGGDGGGSDGGGGCGGGGCGGGGGD